MSMTNMGNWLSHFIAAAAAKSLQSCPTLCDPVNGSPPGPNFPGILQARTLEWVAISFSDAWKWKVKVKSLSHVPLFATPWTAAYQAPPSMGFPRQEDWSEVPLPSPTLLLSLNKSKNHLPSTQPGGAHPCVVAWRIPGTAEPGGLPSIGSHRVRHDWSDLAAAAAAATWPCQ